MITFHVLDILLLQRCGHGHELELDLQGFFDAVRKETQNILAHAASDHCLRVFGGGIGGSGGRGKDPGQHALTDKGCFVFGEVVCVYGVVVTKLRCEFGAKAVSTDTQSSSTQRGKRTWQRQWLGCRS
jgi:hypothetical protein